MAGHLRIDGRELERRVRRGAAAGLNHFGERVLSQANVYVPLDEGTLMQSGHVLEADPREGQLRVQVRFGTVYAARQHEELTWKHDPGRQAKYLETPFKEEMIHLQELVQAAVDAVVRTSVDELRRR